MYIFLVVLLMMNAFTTYITQIYSSTPPNDAATATNQTADPVAVAAAANPPPMVGTMPPSVGAKTPNPCAIVGAAKPVKAFQYFLRYRYYLILGLDKSTCKLEMK